MRATILLIAIIAGLSGCQVFAPTSAGRRIAQNADGVDRLKSQLDGEFDNHEQSTQSNSSAKPIGVPIAHVRHVLRVLEQGRDVSYFSWSLQNAVDKGLSVVWLFRVSTSDGKVTLTPYRPISEGAQDLSDPKHAFKFEADQWAPLEACTQSGVWENATFSAAANVDACSALLPGIGASAALLPLKMKFEGDMLLTTTFADLARGSEAIEQARRVRRFTGWAAINGGGPAATAANQDWHLRSDLQLSSEGGRSPVRWRDGAASGYSVELERRTYSERGLLVLQLDIVEDATGKTLTYAWTDANSNSIGANLGWLQVGLTENKVVTSNAR
jgi:hypothetical protein